MDGQQNQCHPGSIQIKHHINDFFIMHMAYSQSYQASQIWFLLSARYDSGAFIIDLSLIFAMIDWLYSRGMDGEKSMINYGFSWI